MKSQLFIMLLLAGFFFMSCKKESNGTSSVSQLSGRWNLKSWMSNTVSGTSSRKDTANYAPGQYLQFESGGKCIANLDNEITYTTWKISDDKKKLWIAQNGTIDAPDDGFDILILNNNSLNLYSKEISGSSKYEITIYLVK